MSIQAVIFDMDGTLIDSEPFWARAEQEVFSSVGVQLSDELCRMTAGMSTRAVTEFWFERHPWKGRTLDSVEAEVVSRVEAMIREQGRALPGTTAILSLLRDIELKVGLASNSTRSLIAASLEKLSIGHYFHAVHSCEDVRKPKPEPDIYLKAAQSLNVAPSTCLVFEDSATGVAAAINAGMRVIAVGNYNHAPGLTRAPDLVIKELSQFEEHHLHHLVASNGEDSL